MRLFVCLRNQFLFFFFLRQFILAILIEHKLEPLLFLISLIINLSFDLLHLCNYRGIFGHFIALVQEIEAQFDVRTLTVYKLKVGLCLFIVTFGSFLYLKGLISAMNCIFFFVSFGEAGTDVEIEGYEVCLIFFLEPGEVFGESEDVILQIVILHVIIRFGIDISKYGQCFFIAAQSFLELFFLKESIAFLLKLFTEIHLDHIMLFSDNLVLLAIIKPCLEVFRQRLIVLPLIFKLRLFQLCCFGQYLLELLHPQLKIRLNCIILVQMGKKKQQKQYRLNHKKQDPNKQQMADIMKELASMKQSGQQQAPKDKANIDIGLFKKKIKKEEKEKKYLDKNNQKQVQQEESEQVAPAPKVNIFAVDSYHSGVKTIINTPLNEDTIYDENKLIDQTNKLMGGDLIIEKFGQKPLKVIEEEEPVELSEDQNQPNSLKNITHKDIPIPTGNFKIKRREDIEQFRQKLPIYMKEQQIIETINNHLVTLICGQTGSGKSTQIGQFLLEKNYHQFGKVVITQPRRLATIALANRVAEEMDTKLGDKVGFQVRHDRKDSEKTLLKYLTDGILLNEMSSDYLLNSYGVVVIDEAHERKVNTDILIGLLSKLVLIRYQLSLEGKAAPLRLVIMSATMRVQDFQNKQLFDYTVPIINVEARMFPVTTYFQKNTPEDYKQAAVKKCLRIHRKLPDGDVLVFLTGKQEIHEVAGMLEQALERDYFEESQEENDIMHQQVDVKSMPKSHLIYCLYSSLPMAQQQEIFKATPPNCRKFIISTNIAETSITIPNIRYVVDSGQEKHRYHEGVWKWRKGWGSRAMAEQRAGRAGRTTHGYCYRLYSSALYANIMEEYPLPEISKLPLEGVLLQLKSIGIPNVFSFPFPTAPPPEKIHTTLQSLQEIRSIEGQIRSASQATKITQLGNVLSFLPLDPKLGKILLMGRKAGVAKHSLLLVILLTVQSIFLDDSYRARPKHQGQETNLKPKHLQEMRAKSNSFRTTYKKYIMEGHHGDIFTSINILGQFFCRLYGKKDSLMPKLKRQSSELQLNENTMRQIFYNTDQVAQIYATLSNQKIDLSSYSQPSSTQISSLLDILLSVFANNLCRLQQKNKYKNRHNQLVYIHHISDSYLRNNLFVACTEFYGNQQGKTYMRYPFPVRNYELLSTFGQVNPPTDFVWRNNQIKGVSTGVIFGWEIPNLFIESVQDSIKYVYMAKFLMEGKILEQFKVFEKYLKAPTSIIKPSSADYRVQKIVEALKVHKIVALQSLIKWWRKDKKFLKEEVRVWVEMKNFDDVFEKIRETILHAYSE